MPALLAFIIAMFSLQARPPAVPQALAADILFDGHIALNGAKQLAAAYPDRRPGTIGDRQTAARVAASMRAQQFQVTVDRFSSDDKDLVNVIGRRIGQSPRQLVVVVPRDAASVPDLANSASDTASLLEIIRTLQGSATQKTLVLASVDGSTLGAAGAQRLAGQLSAAGPVDAVIVLSNSGISSARGPMVVPWSETTLRGSERLQRTLFDSLRLELPSGSAGHTPGPGAQWARLAFPVGIGDQAPFIEAGMDAARVSGSGELPPARQQPRPDANRIGTIGRATLRTVFAYDAAGAVGESPSSYIAIARDVLPRWSIALLVFTLLLPVLAASVDAFARVRRRHVEVVPWLRWLVAGAVPFLAALVIGYFLALVGEVPDSSSVPVAPQLHRLGGAGWVTLVLCALFFVLALVFVRPRVAGKLEGRDSPGAAAALALTISVVSLAIWVVNPYTALLLLPAFHVWLLVTASPVPASRPVGLALVIGALIPALLILVALLSRLSIGPLAGAWYGVLLLTGHQIGIYTAVVASLLLSCFAAALRIAVAREPAR